MYRVFYTPADCLYIGVSTDVKPTPTAGHGFIELDTGRMFMGDGSIWTDTTASGSGGASWGSITGTLSNQTDLQNALNGKQASGNYATGGGTATGTNTGDQTTVTGNAGTATALQTPRNINGVAFNGTQDITVTANLASTGGGYTTGAGGTVTQATSKATGVTLNKACGRITMHNAALAAGAEVAFTLTNSTIAATDVVVVNVQSVGTAGAYLVGVGAVSAGSCSITVSNCSTGSLSQAIVLNFVVIKGVTA